MELFHYKLLPYLPNRLINAQWEYLKSVMDMLESKPRYNKKDLSLYTCIVLSEMEKRKLIIFGLEKPIFYFDWDDEFTYRGIPNLRYMEIKQPPFPDMFNDDYLFKCYDELTNMFLTDEELSKIKDYIEIYKENKDGHSTKKK